jgi:formate C-acetyltransferase
VAEALDRVMNWDHWQSTPVPYYRAEMDPFSDCEPIDPYGFSRFEEVMKAVKDTLELYIEGFIRVRDGFEDGRLYEIAPLPLLSAFAEGPLEVGLDVSRGGFPYTFHMPELSGLSHAADSLAVIRKLCFEEHAVPWPDLVTAVRENWRGSEPLRNLVRSRVPAYGNDSDYADEIAVELVEHYIACIRRYGDRSQSSIYYLSGIATYENYPELGAMVGATPDGRMSGEPLSSNASPSIGRAVSGQTAAVNSYLKLPLGKLTGGSILDLSIEAKSGLLTHLESFIRSFLQGGGNIVSISINDSLKLRAAQKEPEKYRDLKVRVGGYDAYFVDLPPEHQELQIRRIEQYG